MAGCDRKNLLVTIILVQYLIVVGRLEHRAIIALVIALALWVGQHGILDQSEMPVGITRATWLFTWSSINLGTFHFGSLIWAGARQSLQINPVIMVLPSIMSSFHNFFSLSTKITNCW